MKKIKKGDTVKCNNGYSNKLVKGKIYTVSQVNYRTGLLKVDGVEAWWYMARFDHLATLLGTAVIRNTRNGGYRVNLVGANGEKMYTSEVYTTKAKAKQTARLMKDFEIVDKTKQ